MSPGARKIALGVVMAAMGAAILPQVGPLAFLQVIGGGLYVYVGVVRLKKEIKEEK